MKRTIPRPKTGVCPAFPVSTARQPILVETWPKEDKRQRIRLQAFSRRRAPATGTRLFRSDEPATMRGRAPPTCSGGKRMSASPVVAFARSTLLQMPLTTCYSRTTARPLGLSWEMHLRFLGSARMSPHLGRGWRLLVGYLQRPSFRGRLEPGVTRMAKASLFSPECG